MRRVLAIVGPTAVGKSDLAIKLAKIFDGEIVSCDSMQIYREMDIGTAKPTNEEMSLVPHHMINIKNPDEDYSCAEYALDAKKAIDDILTRNKTPIICGGTGLYLSSLFDIKSFESTKKDDEYRKEMELFCEKNGKTALHNLLKEVDPESAESIHENNVKRVIRALEIYKCTGKKKSELDKESKTEKSPYDSVVIYLSYKDRDKLREAIDKRVDKMVENGLIDEVRSLYNKGFMKEKSTASEAIGYKEFVPYLEGKESLENCIDRLKTSTRQYAKRQMTWFNKKGYNVIYIDEENALERALEIIKGNQNG